VGAGVIDADYRDLVGVVLFNHSETDFAVKPGDRVTEMIVQVIATPKVTKVEDLDATVRRSSRWRTSMPPSGGYRGEGTRRLGRYI
jgi:dUTPase